MNNQKLAWLAGIVDGEGAVYVARSGFLKAKIEITNTNLLMIKEIKRILRKNKIDYYEYDRMVRNRKLEKRIYIHTQNSVLLLSKLLLPYMIAKKIQILLLIKFCELRISKQNHNNGDWVKEEKIYKKLKKMHEKTPTSTATYKEN